MALLITLISYLLPCDVLQWEQLKLVMRSTLFSVKISKVSMVSDQASLQRPIYGFWPDLCSCDLVICSPFILLDDPPLLKPFGVDRCYIYLPECGYWGKNDEKRVYIGWTWLIPGDHMVKRGLPPTSLPWTFFPFFLPPRRQILVGINRKWRSRIPGDNSWIPVRHSESIVGVPCKVNFQF